MHFFEALDIKPGITAIIGSGGKTTLLHLLAHELSGTVLLCTTTKMFRTPQTLLSPTTEELKAGLAKNRILLLGSPAENGKIGTPECSMAQLSALADYVLVEADGAARLSLKAHADFEPVLPEGRRETICVLGLSGLGRPIAEVAHRPEIFAQLAGASLQTLATPELAARVLNREGLANRVLLNQCEGREQEGRALAAALHFPTVLGSLQEGRVVCLS